MDAETKRAKVNAYRKEYRERTREREKMRKAIAEEATKKLWAEQDAASLADWEARKLRAASNPIESGFDIFELDTPKPTPSPVRTSTPIPIIEPQQTMDEKRREYSKRKYQEKKALRAERIANGYYKPQRQIKLRPHNPDIACFEKIGKDR